MMILTKNKRVCIYKFPVSKSISFKISWKLPNKNFFRQKYWIIYPQKCHLFWFSAFKIQILSASACVFLNCIKCTLDSGPYVLCQLCEMDTAGNNSPQTGQIILNITSSHKKQEICISAERVCTQFENKKWCAKNLNYLLSQIHISGSL